VILLAMASLLVGALLAQRFKVLILIPATAIVLGVAFGTEVTHAHTAWSMILTVVTAATSMQIGYLIIGSGVRHVWAGVVSSRPSHVPSTRSARYNAR
jgi:predicted neutral ceramidase superfamily lipid hydrolase